MLLILDSGHCENVCGKEAPDKSFREWEFNNDMQYKIQKEAKKCGLDVYLTNPYPKGKGEIGLSKRASLANDYWRKKGRPKALFVSIHANAYGSCFNSVRGSETYVASNGSVSSKQAARFIQDEVVRCFRGIDSGARDRGVKVNNFTVIYNAGMPSILLEYGFYTNLKDLCVLRGYRDDLVEATLRGVRRYFEI